MGFFDRFRSKPASPSPVPPPPAAPAPSTPAAPAEAPASSAPAPAGAPVRSLLASAREKLDARDLPGALALYERVLAEAGDRADVLVTISGDLGSTGHLRPIVELVAPRYDAERHGPATGLNLVQAYLALREPDAAQHVLDLLYALRRPELDERLHGFSNAIAELLHSRQSPLGAATAPDAPVGEAAPDELPAGPQAVRIDLVTLSKPIWFYGLEPLAERILPPKEGRLRRVAFAQCSVLAARATDGTLAPAAAPLAALARALPAWLAETFYFSPHYAPVAIVGVRDTPEHGREPAPFVAEWSSDNVRQLVDTNKEPIDYLFTGALRSIAEDFELTLRVWEVKKFRERKQFTARWTPATADAELARLLEQIRAFMEWTPDPRALAYTAPASPLAWLELLDASTLTFLADKGVIAPANLPPLNLSPACADFARTSPAASLAWLTLAARQSRRSEPLSAPTLSPNPLVAEATATLGL